MWHLNRWPGTESDLTAARNGLLALRPGRKQQRPSTGGEVEADRAAISPLVDQSFSRLEFLLEMFRHCKGAAEGV